MAKFTSLTGHPLSDASSDFRTAQRVEQYRISAEALYLPDGLRWKYIPLSDISEAVDSFRVISAGHCVPVREKRPELDLTVGEEKVHLQLEKQGSMDRILEAIRKKQG